MSTLMARSVGSRRFMPLKRAALSMAHELPDDLPEGEDMLWQGAPAFWPLAKSLHIRLIAGYFAVLVAWYAVDGLVKHTPGLLTGTAKVGGLAIATLLLIAAYAWLVSITSSYSITSRRVVIQVGIALPISFNLPHARIAQAGLKAEPDGTGDIVLTLVPGVRLGYPFIWPHARPWRFSKAEPMLRAVKEVSRVARILSAQLAATADQPEFVQPDNAQAEPASTRSPGFGATAAAA